MSSTWDAANRSAAVSRIRQLRVHLTIALGLAIVGVVSLGQAASIHLKAWLAQQLISSAWERERVGGRAAKPWAWADTHPVAKLTLGRPGYEVLVLEGSSARNLAFGPVHD